MAEGARAIFEKAAAGGHHPQLEHISGSYRFDVEGTGSWHVTVVRGAVAVTEAVAPADCVIACDEKDLVRIARGEQNLITAALQGRVRIAGDLALAQKLHGFIRATRDAA
jgi:putative sterol carrier protein